MPNNRFGLGKSEETLLCAIAGIFVTGFLFGRRSKRTNNINIYMTTDNMG